MKTKILLFMILWGQSLIFAQQKNFVLHGAIKGRDTGFIKVTYFKNFLFIKDTNRAYIKDNKFVLKGQIDYPTMVFLTLNDSLKTDDLIIEPGVQSISMDATTPNSFFNSINTIGSKINAEYTDDYLKKLQPVFDSLDKWYEKNDSLKRVYKGSTPQPILDNENKTYINIINQIKSIRKNFILSHPSSFVSLWVLYNLSIFANHLELVNKCFKYLDSKFQKTKTWQELNQRLKASSSLLLGKRFPNIFVRDRYEKKYSLSGLITQKYTLLDFWYSHCVPCIAAMPALKNIHNKFNKKGFDIIAISVDEIKYKSDWLKIIIEKELNWKQYWDINSKEAKRLFIDSFPTNFLLDSNGTIIKTNISPEELEIFLEGNLIKSE